ncbi:MAG: tRNA (adenosine(37)-N6)-dimethylallyltransferase MiaA, partial [Candidatus Omnitrophica bacterium]|nr:tRNA (adenosine(37)-N6)-dimethylallyltransferase MiaA [Candidatus Omnitrophota bacterium]
MKPLVIFLVGPTASGKSEIAVELARHLNAEIISCDSMQVYKGMRVLSSQPTKRALKKIKHHLLSIKSPKSEFNVSEYREFALKKIKAIHKKGKIPLLVGGTGFYMSILLDGIFPEVGASEEIRKKLYKQAERLGKEKLYAKLRKVDKEAALKIHPNDLRRVVRALEVYEKTGRPISEWQKTRKGIYADYAVRIFGIQRNQAALIKRINARVNAMLA